jgi:hypothetical protein
MKKPKKPKNTIPQEEKESKEYRIIYPDRPLFEPLTKRTTLIRVWIGVHHVLPQRSSIDRAANFLYQFLDRCPTMPSTMTHSAWEILRWVWAHLYYEIRNRNSKVEVIPGWIGVHHILPKRSLIDRTTSLLHLYRCIHYSIIDQAFLGDHCIHLYLETPNPSKVQARTLMMRIQIHQCPMTESSSKIVKN